jgi:GntR family transcriptional regulator
LSAVDVPEINPRAAEPLYRQIAAWLRARIEAGEFRAGLDPLPSEKDLVGLFGVARDTARRAAGAA